MMPAISSADATSAARTSSVTIHVMLGEMHVIIFELVRAALDENLLHLEEPKH